MRRDFENYLIQVQKQMNELEKGVEEANQLITEGKMDPEVANEIQNYYSTVYTNYQRILYCRYLYTLPPKFIQKLQQRRLNKKTKKFFDEQADAESVISENQENIDKFNEELKAEVEENGRDSTEA